MRVWNGITHEGFVDEENSRFASGLLDLAVEALGKLQNSVTFQFSVEYNKPEPLLTLEDVPDSIELSDGDVTLRDYQYGAIVDAVDEGKGVWQLSTNSGKCVTKDTILTTSRGLMTVEDLFKLNGTPISDNDTQVKEYLFKDSTELVNRYGALEKPSALTSNGVKEVRKITTDLGTESKVTENHPLLVLEDGDEIIWKQSKDIKAGDVLAIVKSDSFNTEGEITTEEAFSLGSSDYEGNEVPKEVMQGTREIQHNYLRGFMIKHFHEEYKSATSKKRVREVQNLFFNFGVFPKIESVKEGYQLTFNDEETYKLLLKNIWTPDGQMISELWRTILIGLQYQETVPLGKGLVKKYIETYPDKDEVSEEELFSEKPTKRFIGKLLERHPGGDPDLYREISRLVSGDIYLTEVTKNETIGKVNTYDVEMPDTNSFIGNGIINHNTKTAIGLIKTALPHLLPKEKVAVFTESQEIFRQFKKSIEDDLGVPVGSVTSQKMDVDGKQVIMCMTGTIANRLNIDVEKEVKLTPKERIMKRMAKLADEFGQGKVNQRILLENYIQNYKVKFKTDETFLEEVRKVLKRSETDAKIIFNLNSYRKKYLDILKDKNGEAYKKKKVMTDFMDSVAVAVYDEAHHVTADTYYTTVLGCENALIKIGMTGSIDPDDKFLNRRLQASFGKIISRTTNEEMIERGISAKPKVAVVPINQVIDEDTNERNIQHEKLYQEAYDVGIVQNQYRNALIAKMTQMWYTREKGVLVVVNRLEHGERIQELLNQLNVPNEFIHGQATNREEALQDMKEGGLKVLISTNIIDEGVDISNIDVLIMSSSGESLRQTLQRVGRSLRKKSQGENKALIIDFDDRTNKYLANHSERRINIYANENFEIEYLER